MVGMPARRGASTNVKPKRQVPVAGIGNRSLDAKGFAKRGLCDLVLKSASAPRVIFFFASAAACVNWLVGAAEADITFFVSCSYTKSRIDPSVGKSAKRNLRRSTFCNSKWLANSPKSCAFLILSTPSSASKSASRSIISGEYPVWSTMKSIINEATGSVG